VADVLSLFRPIAGDVFAHRPDATVTPESLADRLPAGATAP